MFILKYFDIDSYSLCNYNFNFYDQFNQLQLYYIDYVDYVSNVDYVDYVGNIDYIDNIDFVNNLW